MSFNYCIKIVKIKTARISLYSEYQKDSECQKDNKLNCNLLLLKYQKEQNSNIIYHEDKFKILVRRKLECLYFLKYYREYNFNITRSIHHFISKLENHLLNLWYKRGKLRYLFNDFPLYIPVPRISERKLECHLLNSDAIYNNQDITEKIIPFSCTEYKISEKDNSNTILNIRQRTIPTRSFYSGLIWKILRWHLLYSD